MAASDVSSRPSERLAALLARIDACNREDPTPELVDGIPQPRELVYAQRLTDWVVRLNPQASEALRIAARGQHICRWTIARQQYETGRRGYLRWRETLKAFHADKVAALMREVGYPEEMIARVRALMSKRQLSHDPDTQTLEDALCLVFLETQFADLRHKTLEEKMREIVRKTWVKMSEQGRSAALALNLSAEDQAFLVQAIRPKDDGPRPVANL